MGLSTAEVQPHLERGLVVPNAAGRPARRPTWPQGGTFHRAKALAPRGTKGDIHTAVTGRQVTALKGY